MMDNHQNQDLQIEELNEQPAPVEVPKGQAISSMVFGILSIYLGMLPITSIIGIIFSRIAASRAKAFLRDYPETGARGFANAGRITGNIGLPVSIVFTCFWALYFVMIVGLILAGA